MFFLSHDKVLRPESDISAVHLVSNARPMLLPVMQLPFSIEHSSDSHLSSWLVLAFQHPLLSCLASGAS